MNDEVNNYSPCFLDVHHCGGTDNINLIGIFSYLIMLIIICFLFSDFSVALSIKNPVYYL